MESGTSTISVRVHRSTLRNLRSKKRVFIGQIFSLYGHKTIYAKVQKTCLEPV
jgi:hypothetical protein